MDQVPKVKVRVLADAKLLVKNNSRIRARRIHLPTP